MSSSSKLPYFEDRNKNMDPQFRLTFIKKKSKFNFKSARKKFLSGCERTQMLTVKSKFLTRAKSNFLGLKN